MRNILFLLTTADSQAGTERTVINQANALASRGYSVELLSVYNDKYSLGYPLHDSIKRHSLIDLVHSPEIDGQSALSTRIPYFSPSLIIRKEWDDQYCAEADDKLSDFLQASSHDIIIATTPALTAFASEFLPSESIVICQEHRPTTRSGSSRIAPLIAHAARIDCLVSLTHHSTLDISRSAIGSAGINLATIPNALPVAEYITSAQEENTIIASGRLSHQKGFDMLIESARFLADWHPDWKIKIHGEGPKRGELSSLVNSLKLQDFVQLVGHSSQMESAYAASSLFALSSRYEGQGLVILEAMACGLPVVAFDCYYGPKEMVEDGHTGLLVKPGDTRAFAANLSYLISREEVRRNFSAAAREKVKEFSVDRITDQWCALFESLLQDRNHSATRLIRAHERARKRVQAEGEPAVIGMAISDAPAPADAARLEKYATLLSEHRIHFAVLPAARKWSNSTHLGIALQYARRALAAIASVATPHEHFRITKLDEPKKSLRVSQEQLYNLNPANLLTLSIESASRSHEVLGTRTWNIPLILEFWPENPTLACLTPILPNPYFATLDCSALHQKSANHSSWSASSLNLWWKCSFPIDVVYTWVDGEDPVLKEARKQFQPPAVKSHDSHHDSQEATGDHRFRSYSELKYSLRSLHAYMPWVRNIYIVTNGQIPEFVNFEAAPTKIFLVKHENIFPNTAYLPTFNSHAIEANLHRIPGLSEHFLYFNDDTLVGRPQYAENFFSANGISYFFPSPIKVDSITEGHLPHTRAAMNSSRILASDFGFTPANFMLHTPYPLTKSGLSVLTDSYKPEVQATSAARFRSPADLNIASFFYHYFSFAKKQAQPAECIYRYANLGDPQCGRTLMQLLSAEFDFVTVGDSPTASERVLSDLEQFFKRRFPWPSPWERQI